MANKAMISYCKRGSALAIRLAQRGTRVLIKANGHLTPLKPSTAAPENEDPEYLRSTV
jgi:hypothetical protein